MQATEEEIESVAKVAPWDLERVNGSVFME